MGLLGAMAGAGQGLINYSDTLKEKEKMDWLAQQEAVKHERAMNLQKMADKTAADRQQAGFSFQTSERVAGDITAEGVLKGTREYQDKVRGEEQAWDVKRMGLQSASAISTANALATAEEARDLKRTEDRIKALESTDEFKGMPPSMQAKAKLAMRDPDMYKILADTGGEKKVPWEQVQDVWSKARDAHGALDTDIKDQIASEAAIYMDKKSATPEEAATYYANAIVSDFMTTLNFDPTKDVSKPRATREDILAKVEAGEITAAQIAEHKNSDPKLLADAQRIEKVREAREKRDKEAEARAKGARGSGATQAELDAASSFSSSGAPQGTGIKQGIMAGVQRRRDEYKK